MRFPRIKAIRRDKNVDAIDTLEYAQQLAASDAVDQKAIRDLLDRYPLENLTTVALGPGTSTLNLTAVGSFFCQLNATTSVTRAAGAALIYNRTNAASGEVRAYDAHTGALRWSWDPIPRDSADPVWKTWRGAMAHQHRCEGEQSKEE